MNMKNLFPEKTDCVLNARNRDHNVFGKSKGKHYQPQNCCDALSTLFCKLEGKCAFYKSCKEYIREPIPGEETRFPQMFQVTKIEQE